jgi:hypothetical protein
MYVHGSRRIHNQINTTHENHLWLSNIFMYANLLNYIYHALSQASQAMLSPIMPYHALILHLHLHLHHHPRAILDFIFTSASQAKPSQAKGSARTPTVCNVQRVTPFLSIPFHLLPLLVPMKEKMYLYLRRQK